MNILYEYWSKKNLPEKCFWVTFFLFVILFLAYETAFETIIKRYKHSKFPNHDLDSISQMSKNPKPIPQDLKQPPAQTTMPISNPMEILQEILEPIQDGMKLLKIQHHNTHSSSILLEGDFHSLYNFLFFVESKSLIEDFSFVQNERLTLNLRLDLKSPLSSTFNPLELDKIKDTTPNSVFFNPMFLNLEMIINSKARINSKWYSKGEEVFGMKIKDIQINSILLEDGNKNEVYLGLR